MRDLHRSKKGVLAALAGGLGTAGVLTASWSLSEGSRAPERAVSGPHASEPAPRSAHGTSNASNALEAPLGVPREPLLLPSSAPRIEPAATEPYAAALPLPSVLPAPRLPDLGGLMLDPSCDPAAFATWYAPRDASELARARFRLERILVAFDASNGASPIVWLLPSDRTAIEAELRVVDEHLAALPITPDTGRELPAGVDDDDALYARRHADAHPEELFIRRTLVARAVNAEEQRESKRRWALGEYEVVPDSVLMT